MSKSRHIIQRQVIDLQLPDQARAYDLQERIRLICHDRLGQELEKLFDKYVDAHTLIRIDRLELNLKGSIDSEQLEANFVKAVLHAAEDALNQEVSAASQTSGVITHNSTGNSFSQKTSTSQGKEAVFEFFLQQGYLPWYTAYQDFKSFESSTLEWLNTQANPFIFWLKKLSQEAAFQRFIYQFSDGFLQVFYSGKTSNFTLKPILQIISKWEKPSTMGVSERKLRFYFWQSVHQALDKRGDTITSTAELPVFYVEIIANTCAVIAIENGKKKEELIQQFCQKYDQSPSIPQELSSLISQIISELREKYPIQLLKEPPKPSEKIKPQKDNPTSNQKKSFQEQNQQLTDSDPDIDPQKEIDPNQAISAVKNPTSTEHSVSANTTHDDSAFSAESQVNEKTSLSQKAEQERKKPETNLTSDSPTKESSFPDRRLAIPWKSSLKPGEEIYIQDAGLVLFHPFLKALFEQTFLMKNGQFNDESAREKSVQLLAYLSQGADSIPEVNLTIHKLLCNMPFEKPIESVWKLSDLETSSCDELLDAVIEYWKALGTVSHDGLRQGFIQREGKITRTDSGWKVTVERKTMDILMGKLPWGIGFISFPWHEELITVDWA